MESFSLTEDELDALIKRAESGPLEKADVDIIKAMVNAVKVLSQSVNDKAASIKRLLGMVFGPKTEKKKSVCNHAPDDNSKKGDAKKKTRKKGHGKRSVKKFTGAAKVLVPHETLAHKSPCPLCPNGIVYRQKTPGVVIHFTGQVPIQAVVYETEKLRCNLCGEIFTAQAPDNQNGRNYDPSAMAMMAILKYGSGLPWYRLEKLQESMGIPLPASTQWEKTEAAADLIYPIFSEFVRQAAQGEVLHNDDTTMKILSLIKENKEKSNNERTGIFTTGIISLIGGGRRIALFFTGRNHAGENIARLYEKRNKGRLPPIQMCDALSRNTTDEFKVILCNCLTHGRRNFVNVIESFPNECTHLIEVLAEVYHNDTHTKKMPMTPEKRLIYHKEHSGPLMAELRSWLDKQIDDHLVEPNSGLGKAVQYMIKHWPELTRFLEVPGAPLDNNICEQGLKRAILHRKNSLFYKTEHGAFIGDMFMSLIHTCDLMKINVFDYLTTLLKNAVELKKNPSLWMPWNYKTASMN